MPIGGSLGAVCCGRAGAANTPSAGIYLIEVSFKALQNTPKRDYFKKLLTSFALPYEAADCLRAAARALILNLPTFSKR